MKQIFYIVAVIVLMFISYKVMAKVKDVPPEDESIPESLEDDEISDLDDEDEVEEEDVEDGIEKKTEE